VASTLIRSGEKQGASWLGEFDTDAARPNFTAELDGRLWDGGAFEIGRSNCDRPAYAAPRSAALASRCSFADHGTLQRRWRRTWGILLPSVELCLPQFWCLHPARFDAGYCGRWTVCKSGRGPREGVRVFAFRTGWTGYRGDRLGSGFETDGPVGIFRLEYSRGRFPLKGSFINVELFVRAPMVFRVETVGGDVLLPRPPARAAPRGREKTSGPRASGVECAIRSSPRSSATAFSLSPGWRFQYITATSMTVRPDCQRPAIWVPGAHGGPGFRLFWIEHEN